MDGIKKTRGRQKIEMKLIEKEEDRHITFSKRRSGIFKKANEISTLCGANVGVVIFSSSGKPFSYGTPSIDSIANRFLNENQLEEDDETQPLLEAHRRLRVEEVNKEYDQLKSDMDAMKEKGKELKRLARDRREEKGWWEAPIDELGMQELQELNEVMEEFHLGLTNHLAERASNKNAKTDVHSGSAGTSGQGNNNSNISPFVIDANEFDLFSS